MLPRGKRTTLGLDAPIRLVLVGALTAGTSLHWRRGVIRSGISQNQHPSSDLEKTQGISRISIELSCSGDYSLGKQLSGRSGGWLWAPPVTGLWEGIPSVPSSTYAALLAVQIWVGVCSVSLPRYFSCISLDKPADCYFSGRWKMYPTCNF